MILAHHAIVSMYGFWLPNDPRGSYSDFVASWDLFRAGGKATRVSTTRSVAKQPHDVATRLQTKESLQRQAVRMTGLQARAVGRGLGQVVTAAGYRIHACAILPDHLHLVIGWHPRKVQKIVGHLRAAATKRLLEEQLHPFQNQKMPDGRLPSCWGEGCWPVFLYEAADVFRAIRYVENNPVKAGLPAQRWSFVTPWVGHESLS